MKKGMTVVAMATIVLVLVIILSVVVVNGSKAIETSKKIEFLSEILDVQEEVLDYYKQNNDLPILGEVKINVENVSTTELNEFEAEDIVENEVILNELDISKLSLASYKFGDKSDSKDIYLVSQKTKRVYYLKGIKADGIIYYTYTNINLNSVIVPRDVKIYQTKVQDVVFEKSETNYTNKHITTKIYLPINAKNIVVTASFGKSVSSIGYEGFDKVVYVNYESDDKTGNYDITVNYTYNEVDKTLTYKVENFDNTNPEATAYIGPLVDYNREIAVSATDNLSGIKLIKCEAGVGYTKEYFSEFGTLLKEGRCTMKDSTSYTVYVLDNASNYILIQINL